MEFLNTSYEYGYHFVAVHGEVVSSLLYKQSLNASEINHGPMSNFMLLDKPYSFDFTTFWKLLHKLRYHGAGQASFRVADYDGKAKFFEINSRFGGTVFQQCDISALLCF